MVMFVITDTKNPLKRGLLVGVEYSLLIGTFMVSCWINYGAHYLIPSNNSWRAPFYVQMGLASILCFLSFFLPETPRWLAQYGFLPECEQTLADLHAGGKIDDADVQHVFMEIKQATTYESRLGKVSWGVSSNHCGFLGVKLGLIG